MAKIERPAWVGCLVLIWIIILPGIILTHMALADLSTPLKNLRENVIRGFDEVFKFAHLEEDSDKVKNASAHAVAMCGENATQVCPLNAPPTARANPNQNTSVVAEKAAINQAFSNSLSEVDKVTNDPYFGVDGFKNTADSLNEIQNITAALPNMAPCSVVVPGFCETWRAADDIILGMDDVDAEIDKFKKSDAIEDFNKYRDVIDALHVLPYLMVFALAFFSYFFYQGGLCCCCRGGTIRGSLCLFPFAFCWLIGFVIWVAICATGVAVVVLQDDIKVSELKGDPTVGTVIDHIQEQYPEFWNMVFADLEDGLKFMYFASWFVLATALLIFLFTCAVCICRPYHHALPKEEGAAPAAAAPAQAAPQQAKSTDEV